MLNFFDKPHFNFVSDLQLVKDLRVQVLSFSRYLLGHLFSLFYASNDFDCRLIWEQSLLRLDYGLTDAAVIIKMRGSRLRWESSFNTLDSPDRLQRARSWDQDGSFGG